MKTKRNRSINARQRRDLRGAILSELHEIQPLGRTAIRLHELVQRDVTCTRADVEAQLAFLQRQRLIYHMDADQIFPGVPPFWFITRNGITLCEEKHLV